jgi:hypothetical protein
MYWTDTLGTHQKQVAGKEFDACAFFQNLEH